ncbi:MAG TPA: cytochrome d ubiquinol oxidase subunit II [Terriglobales bacterium]|jgi:cytochrome d ubiquinol oxidase subunit II|nr:cytochrome d ubiquinol oxidase subunit II [Terriglobales bacterium]
METLWFIIVAVMLTAYVVLDGFDLGAGIIYLFAARTNEERRMVLRAIGPVWDGNEVWLLAAGGTLYFAFPQLYASSFSGFYLPLMMVLWLLMLRAIGIEFRTHIDEPVWQGFFDVIFSLSSVLLAIFFGAALGNVIRGVPLGPDGYFFEPLWTDFRVGRYPGILDWYTVMAGVVALVTLTAHGALYVAIKTEGELSQRARRFALTAWPLQLLLTLVSLLATYSIQPQAMNNYRSHAVGMLVPLAVVGSLAVMFWAARKEKDRIAFGASSLYIAAMLVGAAFALYPVVLPASTDPAYSLTIYNSAAGRHGLTVGIVWWILGMLLALGYFVFIYRMFRGKVRLEGQGY